MSNSAISCPQLSGALVPSRVCRSSTVARSLPDTIWKIECSVVKYVKNLGSVTSIVNYIETQWWTCMETWNYFIIPHHSFLLLYPHPHTLVERVCFNVYTHTYKHNMLNQPVTLGESHLRHCSSTAELAYATQSQFLLYLWQSHLWCTAAIQSECSGTPLCCQSHLCNVAIIVKYINVI